jgi:hypothetical protein
VERAENVANPELAAVDVPVKMADGVETNDTVADDVVTRLPYASSTATSKLDEVPPAVNDPGWVTNTSSLDAAGLTVNELEVAVVSVPEVAVTV